MESLFNRRTKRNIMSDGMQLYSLLVERNISIFNCSAMPLLLLLLPRRTLFNQRFDIGKQLQVKCNIPR